jgi:hypothetical protein
VIVLALGLVNCASPTTGVTEKPSVAPVRESNEQLKASVKGIRKNTSEAIEVNKSVQANIDAAIKEIDKMLK